MMSFFKVFLIMTIIFFAGCGWHRTHSRLNILDAVVVDNKARLIVEASGIWNSRWSHSAWKKESRGFLVFCNLKNGRSELVHDPLWDMSNLPYRREYSDPSHNRRVVGPCLPNTPWFFFNDIGNLCQINRKSIMMKMSDDLQWRIVEGEPAVNEGVSEILNYSCSLDGEVVRIFDSGGALVKEIKCEGRSKLPGTRIWMMRGVDRNNSLQIFSRDGWVICWDRKLDKIEYSEYEFTKLFISTGGATSPVTANYQ